MSGGEKQTGEEQVEEQERDGGNDRSGDAELNALVALRDVEADGHPVDAGELGPLFRREKKQGGPCKDYRDEDDSECQQPEIIHSVLRRQGLKPLCVEHLCGTAEAVP